MKTVEHQNAVTIIHEELAAALSAAAPLIQQGAQVTRCIHKNGAWQIRLTTRDQTNNAPGGTNHE